MDFVPSYGRGDADAWAQGQIQSSSVMAIGAPSFQESEVPVGHFARGDYREELQGSEGEKALGLGCAQGIRQGSWDPKLAALAQK